MIGVRVFGGRRPLRADRFMQFIFVIASVSKKEVITDGTTKTLSYYESCTTYHVLKDVMEKKLKGSEATHILGLRRVHLSRLMKRPFQEGFDGLLIKAPLTLFPTRRYQKKTSNKSCNSGKDYTTLSTLRTNSTKSTTYPILMNQYDKSFMKHHEHFHGRKRKSASNAAECPRPVCLSKWILPFLATVGRRHMVALSPWQ